MRWPFKGKWELRLLERGKSTNRRGKSTLLAHCRKCKDEARDETRKRG